MCRCLIGGLLDDSHLRNRHNSVCINYQTLRRDAALSSARFAQMSYASWRWGYFNVYDMTSRVRDLDFIVFLGDCIYEYGSDQYPAQEQGRVLYTFTPPSTTS